MKHKLDEGQNAGYEPGENITDPELRYQFFERLQEYLDNQYKVKRQAEYPSIQDQLDILYHGGYDAWKAQIEAVKNKYPKPTE